MESLNDVIEATMNQGKKLSELPVAVLMAYKTLAQESLAQGDDRILSAIMDEIVRRLNGGRQEQPLKWEDLKP
jgi:hypothetical protein